MWPQSKMRRTFLLGGVAVHPPVVRLMREHLLRRRGAGSQRFQVVDISVWVCHRPELQTNVAETQEGRLLCLAHLMQCIQLIHMRPLSPSLRPPAQKHQILQPGNPCELSNRSESQLGQRCMPSTCLMRLPAIFVLSTNGSSPEAAAYFPKQGPLGACSFVAPGL